jgi:hypothetical protein
MEDMGSRVRNQAFGVLTDYPQIADSSFSLESFLQNG